MVNGPVGTHHKRPPTGRSSASSTGPVTAVHSHRNVSATVSRASSRTLEERPACPAAAIAARNRRARPARSSRLTGSGIVRHSPAASRSASHRSPLMFSTAIGPCSAVAASRSSTGGGRRNPANPGNPRISSSNRSHSRASACRSSPDSPAPASPEVNPAPSGRSKVDRNASNRSARSGRRSRSPVTSVRASSAWRSSTPRPCSSKRSAPSESPAVSAAAAASRARPEKAASCRSRSACVMWRGATRGSRVTARSKAPRAAARSRPAEWSSVVFAHCHAAWTRARTGATGSVATRRNAAMAASNAAGSPETAWNACAEPSLSSASARR